MTTKEKILQEALSQFNSDGTERVTTRHIATSLKMSQGNLHYHFPNKNQLISELYLLFKNETKAAQRMEGKQFPLEEMYLSMQENFKIMAKYKFLFLDRDVIWRRLPEIEAETLKLIVLKKEQLRQAFKSLRKKGKVKKILKGRQFETFLDSYLLLVNSWLHTSRLVDLEKEESEANYFAEVSFRLMLPYLKASELKKWQQKLKKDNKYPINLN